MFKGILKTGLNLIKWCGWIVIYLISTTFLQLATSATTVRTRNIFLMFYIIIAVMTLIWIISYYRKKISTSPYLHRNPLSLSKILQWIGFVALMLTIQTGWGLLVTYHLIKEPDNQNIINQAVQVFPFWNNFDDIIIAPIFEETIFRGLFFQYFFPRFSRWGKIIGLILSSLVFGYLHVLSFDINMIMYSGLGLVLGLTYLHFRDLRYDIGLHIFNNLLSSL